MAIAANAAAGMGALAAWRQPVWRGRWVWLLAGAAQIALVLQVTVGAALMSDERYAPPRLHTFYGFVGFATVGIAYASRDSMRGRLEMFYGLIGLFLMGIGIRAYLQA